MKVEKIKWNVRWIVILTSVVLALSLCVVPVEAKNKKKLVTKKVVTIYGSDRKTYRSGSTIPLSALDGASIKISGLSKKKAYMYEFIVSAGKYELSKDTEPNWGYGQAVANKASLRKQLKKKWFYLDYIGRIGKKIHKNGLDYCRTAISEYSYYDSITFELRPVDKKLNFTNTYYENYFKVDVNK